MLKKYIVKIPYNIKILYSNNKKLVLMQGVLTKKLLKLNVQLFILHSKNNIKITILPFLKMFVSKKKKLKIYQKTVVALIKQHVIEISIILYRKLKLVGVGYRVLSLENLNNKLLLFKLGFSHFLYFKVPQELKIFCLKLTKIFIFGNSYQNVAQIASSVRSYKKPEPYKSKGILYVNEKILLKEKKKA